MSRTAIRENAFKLLYSNEIQKEIDEEQLQIFIQENNINDEEQIKYIKNSFEGVQNNIVEINKLIEKNLTKKWTIDRISKIDIAILKLAIYEMVYTELPYKVVINEAVELAKKYGDESSKSFINGILASVVKEMFEK